MDTVAVSVVAAMETISHSVFFALRLLPPEATLFLAIALGYAVGQIRFGKVQFGGVCGTLIMALLLGQSGVVVDGGVKSFFFALFIFALGFAGGPQFFANLNAKTLRLVVLSLIEVTVVFSLALGAMRFFGIDAGTAAGLVAGAATESAVIGTASEALGSLALPQEEITRLQANVVTAYSVTYIFGLVAIVLFTSQIAPALLRANLRRSAESLWQHMQKGLDIHESDTVPAAPGLVGRLYSVSYGAGKSVENIETLLGSGAHIGQITRRRRTVPVTPGLVLEPDDIVLIMGSRSNVLQASAILGKEVAPSAGTNMVVETVDYVFLNQAGAEKTLGELVALVSSKGLTSEVYLCAVIREGHAMPLTSGLTLQLGDIVRLCGSDRAVARLGRLVGKPVNRTFQTNFVFIGFGLVAGLLIGRLSLTVDGVMLTLGSGGGALLSGLLCGWYQAKHPQIQGAPRSSLEIMKDFGLSAFVACVGLASGPHAIALVQQYGLRLPALGVAITLIPALLSLAIGHWLLRLELPVLLGGIAGQQCSTPALSAVQAAAGNTTPLIGYTITYAISNALLPLLGPLIVGVASLVA